MWRTASKHLYLLNRYEQTIWEWWMCKKQKVMEDLQREKDLLSEIIQQFRRNPCASLHHSKRKINVYEWNCVWNVLQGPQISGVLFIEGTAGSLKRWELRAWLFSCVAYDDDTIRTLFSYSCLHEKISRTWEWKSEDLREPLEHERGSPKVNVFTSIHLWNAPFSVPITRSQRTFSFFGVIWTDHHCGLVVRVPGYRSTDPGSILDVTRFSEKQWVWNGVYSASWVQLRSCLTEKVVAPV
jgi:hypothetical protein